MTAASVRKSLRVCDAKNTAELPGVLVRSDGTPPVDDPAVNEAYEFMGDTFDFFHELFGRNSLDDAGMPLIASVHVAEEKGGELVPLNDVYWNGVQLVCGDGDGVLFRRFTQSPGAIAHELFHAVQQSYPNRLIDYGQPGALSFHFCNVFGVLVRQWRNHRAGKPERGDERWLLAREILVPAPTRHGLFDLKRPGTAFHDDPRMGNDPQVCHMENLNTNVTDSGGVNINAGIPNRAFVLAAEAVGGDPWDVPAKVWYSTLPQLPPSCGFAEFAELTVKAAQTHGPGVAEAVRGAWQAVGVTPGQP